MVTEFVTKNVHAVSFMLLIVACYFILVLMPYMPSLRLAGGHGAEEDEAKPAVA